MDINKKGFKEKDKVIALRAKSKWDKGVETEGEIVRFSNIVTVRGKNTALVKFSDNPNDMYYFPIDELKSAEK